MSGGRKPKDQHQNIHSDINTCSPLIFEVNKKKFTTYFNQLFNPLHSENNSTFRSTNSKLKWKENNNNLPKINIKFSFYHNITFYYLDLLHLCFMIHKSTVTLEAIARVKSRFPFANFAKKLKVNTTYRIYSGRICLRL